MSFQPKLHEAFFFFGIPGSNPETLCRFAGFLVRPSPETRCLVLLFAPQPASHFSFEQRSSPQPHVSLHTEMEEQKP